VGHELGGFTLEQRLGRGGMGVVWSGVHRQTRVPVAIKAVRADVLLDERSRASFAREVGAVAGLSHHRIVEVYEYGELPEGLPVELVAGSPYLVMELVAGGSLHDRCGTLDWAAVRTVVLELLDALAHAHARGVIHRDLKPANVLLDPDGHIKLTDFGIAHLADRATESDMMTVAGTPAFMAPEQFWDDPNLIGPWTDLYSLGCLVWLLVTGRMLFKKQRDRHPQSRAHRRASAGATQWVRAHSMQKVPRFSAPGYPRGLESWLRCVLAKSPDARFQRAADAAAIFAGLALADSGSVREARRAHQGAVQLGELQTLVLNEQDPFLPEQDRLLLPESSASAPPGQPLPQGWEELASVRSQRLLDVGIGLWAVRQIRLAGRRPERDLLWDQLRSVQDGGVAVAVITGVSGIGKSALAGWLACRAHEQGAWVLRVEDGGFLRTLVADRCDVTKVASTIEPRAERQAVILDHLERRSAGRPVVLLFEDAHHRRSTIQLIALLLRVSRARPKMAVHVIATAADVLLAANPDVNEALQDVLDHEDVLHIPLQQLEPNHMRRLVTERMGLEGSVAALVEDASGGNAGFALALVGDWIGRGLLAATPHGFALTGPAPALPESLREVWEARLDGFLSRRPKSDALQLEIAAILGRSVDAETWSAAVRASGGEPSPELPSALLRTRLMLGTATGWRFAHAVLVEILCQRARSANRWTAHHQACAGAVAGARAGRHLLEAGRHEEALPHLLRAAKEVSSSHFAKAHRLLSMAERASNDPFVRGQIDRQRIVVLHNQGRNAEALALSKDLVVHVDEPEWADLKADILALHAKLLRNRGHVARAFLIAERAAAAYRAAGNLYGEATCELELAWCQAVGGEPASAKERLERLLERPIGIGHQSQAHYGIVSALMTMEENDSLRHHVEQATHFARISGTQLSLARCLSIRGSVAKTQGRLEEALSAYREAVDVEARAGSTMEHVDRLNLASGLLALGRAHEALGALGECPEAGRRFIRASNTLLRAACYAHLGEIGAWSRTMDQVEHLFSIIEQRENETPKIASEMARALGNTPEARRAWAFAATRYASHGDGEAAARATANSVSLPQDTEAR